MYIGIIAYLAYLLLKKKNSVPQITPNESTSGGTTAGNASNGGLNLGENMDLPNLTPTASNGLSTEVALNSSNVSPLVKDDNEPTQIFGAQLPAGLPQYSGTSAINPNPLNIGATESPSASTTQPATASTIENASASTRDYTTVPTTQATTTPTTPTPFVPKKTIVSASDLAPISVPATASTTPLAVTSPTQPVVDVVTATAVIPKRKIEDVLIKNTDISATAPIVNGSLSTAPVVSTNDYQTTKALPSQTIKEIVPTSGSSTISEPVFTTTPTKSIPTLETISSGTKAILPEPLKDQIISQCGNSFSIPNNDKEGSYTNFWYDGTNFYMQTTSPMVKTIATKISKDAFVEGCRKMQSYQMQQTK